MPPPWRFLLDRGVDFRTKRELLQVGFPAVLQLADVGLTGLATDPEIFSEAQQQRLILITKDTDFTRLVRYALGHDGILHVTQSKTELQDTVTAVLTEKGFSLPQAAGVQPKRLGAVALARSLARLPFPLPSSENGL